MSKNKHWWLVVVFLGAWRGALAFLAVVADKFLPYEPTFPYAREVLATYDLPRWLYSWANFDGIHYLTIAEKGYVGTGLIQAFFPLFPFLIRGVNLVLHNTILSGLVLSNIMSLILALVWFWWLAQKSSPKLAWVASFTFWLWPTSFFLGAMYSESLFLVLVIGTFWAAEKKHWWVAGMLGALVSASRVVGIFILPALAWLWWQDRTDKSRTQLINEGAALAFCSVGLLAFMAYLWQTFGDPLYFFHVQAEFGAGRQETIILLPQVFWRYGKMLSTVNPDQWGFWSLLQEVAIAAVGGLGLAWGWWQIWSNSYSRRTHQHKSYVTAPYLLFATLAYLLPTVTGTFSSMPRYILACFPLFILVAEWLQSRRWWLAVFLIGSTILLVINTVRFIQGYWVA